MTMPDLATPTSPATDLTPAQHHPHRWRLHRAGITNVWFYFDTEFAFSGGRLVLRGTNGSGKSRALEMLLPFVLDADRRRIDATGSGKVRLEDLMRAGSDGQPNRLGYLWLELTRNPDEEVSSNDAGPQFLTVGVLVRFSKATAEAKAWYFTTPLRVGHDLVLLDSDRHPLSRDQLAETIGAERITDSPEAHRERLRTEVFGLTGESGRERYAGLLQLLHTLRSPDVGNRIEEGKLPLILSDALPPLSEASLIAAGDQLDGLSDTRAAQKRLESDHEHVTRFLDIYRRYVVATLTGAATEARSTAGAVRQAEARAEQHQQEHSRLVNEHAEVIARVLELTETKEELSATIDGIKGSRAYSDARDLDERARRVAALGQTADRALAAAETARSTESESVDDADNRTNDVVAAAQMATTMLNEARAALRESGVSAALPESVTVHVAAGNTITDAVRITLYEVPEPLPRPVAQTVTLSPADLDEASAQLARAKTAAHQRASHASTRLTQARALLDQQRKVETAEERAEGAEERASLAVGEAEQAADVRDDAAVELAHMWRGWVSSDSTSHLLPDTDWSTTAVAALLADAETLIGPGDAAVLLDLDQVAEDAAIPTRDGHARYLARLDSADADDDAAVGELRQEQDRLRAAVDPDPAGPGWAHSVPDGGIALWRLVDFSDGLNGAARAGLEAALLASGLLTATVTPDSALSAADGQLLVTATGPTASTPLSGVLTIEPSGPIPIAIVRAVLERISVGDRGHPTWVDVDGSWGNGPLEGRHTVPSARHIGARARAAARATRLAEIDAALTAYETDRQERHQQRKTIKSQRAALDAHLRTAPRSQNLSTARALAGQAAMRARTADAQARELRGAAQHLRREWTSALTDHRAACASFSLPDTARELADTERNARDAAHRTHLVTGQMQVVGGTVAARLKALSRLARARADRERTEVDAQGDWRIWHEADAEFSAIKENVGAEADQVRTELQSAEAERKTIDSELDRERKKESQLASQKGAAEVEARTGGERAQELQRTLAKMVERLSAQLALPGVVAAATSQPTLSFTLPEVTAGAVEAVVRTVLASLDGRGGPVDENALIRGQQILERELSGTFDVVATVVDGVRLVEVIGEAGRRTIAAAGAELERQRDEGAAALSEHERQVFTEFVLGGVAEELRRRLGQASSLVAAMNASLAQIRTSHGIGVKLRWKLSEDPASRVGRIRALVETAGDVRSLAQTGELTDLLRNRVEEVFATDPTAGYGTHLKAALDYRAWHEVEVVITGPGPDQERRISRRAKLSQGEIRFVSYVTLFAAVDAYLTGLPDHTRALRLLLLDDAFAKVDDRTIGELMGLLVRLDVDFAMTGHALWGCYPQVPALDCYEVRRREGTAAVTTHVHWDGRNRHLRAAR